MADCGSVDMETLVWQLADRFLPACEQCGQGDDEELLAVMYLSYDY
jgi:hypothetical protein